MEAERAVHGMRGEHRDKYDQNDRAVWFASLDVLLTECDEVPVRVLVQGDNPVQVSVPALDDETVPVLASAVSVPALHDETVQELAVSDERWAAEPVDSALDERWAEEPDDLALDERWAKEPGGSALDERWAEEPVDLALDERWAELLDHG